MKEVYYKKLIKEYGLWYSPDMTATIIKEAHSHNWYSRKDLNIRFHWKDVAKDLGVSPITISKIKTGKQFPSSELMDKLVNYLDLVV